MKIVGRRKVELEGNSSQGYNNNQDDKDRGNGYTYEYKLDNGDVVTSAQAYDMALNGELEGVIASHNGSTKYIRTIGDGKDGNDLNDLPSF